MFVLKLISRFAQFHMNIQNIPHLWPFYTYGCGFLCCPSKSYFECVVILMRVVIVTIINFFKNDNRLASKRLPYTSNINTMLLKLTMS